MSHHAEKDAPLLEPAMYLVKEVSTWHGRQDTPRFAAMDAQAVRRSAAEPTSTPDSTTAGLTSSSAGAGSVTSGPAARCPECGEPVTREQPCWVEPETKQLHHDPCPTRVFPPEGGQHD